MIADVDAENAEREAELAQRRRGVWAGQSNAHGVKTVYARMDAPDAIRIMGQVNRVADVLGSRGLAGTADTRRATALGVLADPIQTAWLLANQTQPELFDATAASIPAGTVAGSATDPHAAAPAIQSRPTPERTTLSLTTHTYAMSLAAHTYAMRQLPTTARLPQDQTAQTINHRSLRLTSTPANATSPATTPALATTAPRAGQHCRPSRQPSPGSSTGWI